MKKKKTHAFSGIVTAIDDFFLPTIALLFVCSALHVELVRYVRGGGRWGKGCDDAAYITRIIAAS